MKLNKVVSIGIKKPKNIDWGEFRKLLYRLQRDTRIILNKTIQLCWEYDGFASDYKNKHDTYPKEEEVLIGSKGKGLSLQGYIYDKLKKESIMYSANNSQTQQFAVKRWKSDKIEIFKGERSITNYKRDAPINLHNKSINLYKDNNKFSVKLKLLNNEGKKELEFLNSEIEAELIVKDNSTRTILDRIISGKYKVGASQIVQHKHKRTKWFLLLNYQFEAEEKKLDENNVMGIDMGVCTPVYVAFNNSLNRYSITGGEIEHFRRVIESRRKEMLRQSKYCGKGRRGRGRRARLAPLEKLSSKVSNFRKTCNHKYSKYVIDLAIKHNCGVIQMEDLTGVADGERKATFLGEWTYYDLQQKIEYKAKEKGIKVIKINPYKTSQRCSECGYIHKDNRPKEEKGQSYFKCVKCEYQTHADYNAAKNIATPNIEEIIKEQLEKQEEKTRNKLKYVV